jgi:hypothetical protein
LVFSFSRQIGQRNAGGMLWLINICMIWQMLFPLFMEGRKVIVIMCIGRKLQIIKKNVNLVVSKVKKTLTSQQPRRMQLNFLWMLFERSKGGKNPIFSARQIEFKV